MVTFTEWKKKEGDDEIMSKGEGEDKAADEPGIVEEVVSDTPSGATVDSVDAVSEANA